MDCLVSIFKHNITYNEVAISVIIHYLTFEIVINTKNCPIYVTPVECLNMNKQSILGYYYHMLHN